MRVVVGLGGNALLRRGEPLLSEVQSRNIRAAATALAVVGRENELVLVHGSGPQVGLLALQDAASPQSGNFPLDVLNAETAGMIGYPVARELRNALPDRQVVNVLTQVVVETDDPAFAAPSKPIGPVYSEEEAGKLAELRGWAVAPDGDGWRRVVPSPAPRAILEMDSLKLLVEAGVVLLCAGGGGVPVTVDGEGRATGVEAIIDKDASAALVARELSADALLLLTDVSAVEVGWGTPEARPLGEVTASELAGYDLAEGSMGPKAEAAIRFVEETGRPACIGRLEDAQRILAGEAGTRVVPG